MRLKIVGGSRTWLWLQRAALGILGLVVLLSITGILLMGPKPAGKSTKAPSPVAIVPTPAVSPPQEVAPLQAPQNPPPSVGAVEPPKAPVGELPAPAPAKAGPAEKTEKTTTTPAKTSEETRPEAPKPRGPRLRGPGPVVVLAVEETDAAELREHPERLTELIQNGSLFTVPNDTPIELTETHPGVVHVHVLSGAFEGRDGWVRSDQVTKK